MMSSEYINMFDGYFSESSPSTNIPGEEFVDYDIDALASNDSYGNEESYGWYIPIYYPMPTSYYMYNVVTPVEWNGTVFYNYHQLAVPDYSYSFDEVTTEDSTASDFNSIMPYLDFVSEHAEEVHENSSHEFATNLNDGDPEELLDEFEEFYEESSLEFPSENNSSIDLNGTSPPPEFLDEFEEFYAEERYSSQLMIESSLMATERRIEIKRREDWLYLLSLSGKLRLKDSIPDVQILPVITEEEEENHEIDEMSDEELEPAILDEALWKDTSPLIDKSDGDHEKEYTNDDAVEASNCSMSASEFHDRLGDKDFWDSILDSIDEVEHDEFKIESCFSGSSENELAIESLHNDIEEYNSNPPAFCRKVRKRLRLLTKDIAILPTIYEEDEPPDGDGDIRSTSEKIILKPNKGYSNVVEERVQRVESGNDYGLSKATDKEGASQKPNKKRFKGLRRLMSRLTSCFRKEKEAPG